MLRSIPGAFFAVSLVLVSAQPVFAAPKHTFAAPRPVTVRAVIWPNLAITVAPDSFKAGRVTIIVKNRDRVPHQFAINGTTWPKIKPNKSAAMTVTFKKPSVYGMTLPDYYPGQGNRYVVPGASVKVTR
jgi:hypothetical protein